MDQNDKSNITTGSPKTGGAIFWAPAGTALPTSATATLDPAFKNLGYVTEDGLTATVAEDGNDVKDWDGETVMHTQTSYAKTYSTNLMESSRIAVLEFLYGKSNVNSSGGTITWDETGDPLPRGVMVVDTLQSNGEANPRIRRQVIADAQFTDRSGDHTYNKSDPLAYPIALTAYKTLIGGKRMYVKNYLSAPQSPAS